MVQASVTQTLISLLREDALSGKFTVKQLQDRYKVGASTAYEIVGNKGRYAKDSSEPIKIKKLREERVISAALFMHHYLGINKRKTSVFLGKSKSWYYQTATQLGVDSITTSVPIPVAIKEKFADAHGNALPSGFYKVSYVDAENVLVTRINNKNSGCHLVPVKEIVGRCSLIEGAHYE